MMKAAVVRDFSTGPHYEGNFLAPIPEASMTKIEVTASALSNVARSVASGQHYSVQHTSLPVVPGIDGVGILPSGQKVYFVSQSGGAMAAEIAVKNGDWVYLAGKTDDAKIAGMMNPAMSSWMALHYRTEFKAGQKVMILGASGNAGKLALQIAKRLGAAEIIAVARDHGHLDDLYELGATQIVSLSDDAATIATNLASVGENVDMVLDYLWGDVTASALTAIIPARADANQLLTWVNIGSVVGPTTALPAASLRAVNLRLVGSGFGSVKMAQLLSLLQGIADAEVAQPFVFEIRREALTDIAQVWTEKTSERIVFVL